MDVRQPAVAGFFYPDDPVVLRRDIDHYLAQNPCSGVTPKALVVPHAGYAFSGPVAARAYNLLRALAKTIRRVVLLGPSHRVPLRGLALPGCDTFMTPLGAVALDSEGMAALARMPQVRVMPSAHAQEHSLEVQLPFLQRLLDDFRLLPLVVGQCQAEEVDEVLEQVWGGRETLIVISSDLSHYHPYGEAQRLDRATSEAVCACRAQLSGEQACGAYPLNGLLHLAARRGLEIELLDLRNSGDTEGPRDRVVGYGAYALH
ncbi:AmmeMemoRadiSam system protein B [Motiliproteus sp. SC1-56]|uniref:AmmeMemoRadiSam system protein B n=1 Tax=Motiliproteus sp. SC1-56 TaxID=2799565 RepID=UPI001A90774B|nr:AmmeMemoRadiSam system protein B [Motiliproteus sp. SC1-56]